MMGKTILITSHTHSAVDNVLVRLLKENLQFLRIGDPSRVAEAVRPFCECTLTKHCKSPEDMDAVYNQFVSMNYVHLFEQIVYNATVIANSRSYLFGCWSCSVATPYL